MNQQREPALGLVLIGAARRLAIACLIAATLWGGFYWATSSPGGL